MKNNWPNLARLYSLNLDGIMKGATDFYTIFNHKNYTPPRGTHTVQAKNNQYGTKELNV